MEAYDANTGKLIWDFHTTAAPDQPGGNMGMAMAGNIGGGSVWNTPAIDLKSSLIVFATGNPNPDYRGETARATTPIPTPSSRCMSKPESSPGGIRKCRMICGTMTPARRSMLFDAKDANGHTVPAAGEAGKVGNVFIVNRLTGKLLHKSDPFVDQSANMFTAPPRRPYACCRASTAAAVAAAGLFAADRLFLCAGRQYPYDLHGHRLPGQHSPAARVGRHTGGGA